MADPGELKAARRGAEWALAAATAQELGCFRELARGPVSPRRLAEALSLDVRGTSILLGALVDLGLVREEPEGFRLTGQGRARFVDRDTPDFEGDAVRLWLANIRGWAAELEEAVRRGEPPSRRTPPGRSSGEEEEEEESLSRFMAAMASKDPALVERAVEECRRRLRESGRDLAGARALDLGGGPGAFARALAEAGARTVLADRPEVIAHVTERYGLGDAGGLELWGGDFLEELPEGDFDLVLLANITHIYDEETNAALLRRLGERIRPGGVVAILDFVRGVSEFASLFAITMLLNTQRGGTYGREEYEAWLKAAGFGALRLVSLDADRQLITARREGG